MENAIEVHGLQKRYGQTIAVDGLTFNVAAGEIFGLLGPNDAVVIHAASDFFLFVAVLASV